MYEFFTILICLFPLKIWTVLCRKQKLAFLSQLLFYLLAGSLPEKRSRAVLKFPNLKGMVLNLFNQMYLVALPQAFCRWQAYSMTGLWHTAVKQWYVGDPKQVCLAGLLQAYQRYAAGMF